MILQKLQSANSIILDSVNATNNKQAVENFIKQLSVLSATTTQLEQLLNLMDAMQAKGIIPHIMTAEIKDALLNAVNSCGEKTDDHSLDAGTVSALKNAVDLCKNTITAMWKESAGRTCTPLIESMTSLRGLFGDTKEVDRLIDYLSKLKTNLPSSVSALDTYLSNVDKAKKIVEDLHFDSDAEVKTFIEKVRAQKATVAHLTPHILEWLNENHLTYKIKLRF